ncbi:MAG: elongation factor P [Holosporales bacterium]
MKINGNEIRPGNVIEHKGRLWVAVKTEHVKPGKGGAYMQVELKDLRENTKLNERFRSGETVERVRLEERLYQFLFSDDSQMTVMDQETFDQIMVPLEELGDAAPFLQEGMILTVCLYEEKVVSVRLPETVIMEVVEADPVVKGQTATSSYKPAVLENGLKVLVPPYITSGTKIVIKTETQEYVERAK